jgi:PAS domain S-box-containing protein
MKGTNPLRAIAAPVGAQYRDKVLYALALVATVGVVPFAVLNIVRGYALIGSIALGVVLVLVVDALAIWRGRRPPLPMAIAFAAIVVGVVLAVWQRGVMTVFWTFPSILLFHFVLERRLANLFNLTMVAIVGAALWQMVEAEFALRVIACQLLTIAFTNIFSYAVEAEQRKETEQRRRINLLARATQAGFFEWERHGDKSIYSGRLKEMLGYSADADTKHWKPFPEFIHPEDREQRVKLFQESARTRGEPGSVLRHIPGQHRLLHASGALLWVHVEGLFIYGPDRRVARYIAAMYDVTELHRREHELRSSHNQIEVQAKQLRDQNRQLREAMRVREEVERIARHDLKTPLHSIAAVPRLLRAARPVSAREEELLAMVEGAAYRMLDMVNLSVDLYRMEQGQYRYSPRAVDLAQLVDTVWREVRAHADTKRLRLEKRVTGAPLAWGEPLLCYSLLANLIKNAVEASPDGSAVTVTLTAVSNCVLEVHNDGLVPETMRERFFDKYATHGKPGGHGLGTYSARLMARVQKGELAMRTSEAEGTTLTLTLEAPPAQVAVPASAALPPLRVLVVDDDEFNIMFMRGTLPSPPLAVEVAINGRAALEAARRNAPDVVFMDLEMPVMDGFQATAALRAAEARGERKRAAIFAFSSYDDAEIRARCEACGFDGYLAKPVAAERVDELLRALRPGLPPAQDDPVAVDPDIAAALPRFLESRRALAAQLERALAAGEREAARVAAHQLAGSLALYGFRWAAAAAREIQAHAQHGVLESLRDSSAALRRHLDEVKLDRDEKEAAAGR